MNTPQNLMYTRTHEWILKLPDGRVRIGLTDYAQSELGDLVFVNLPQPEDELSKGESFADVESVKAVSDIYSPVNGVVAAVNEALLDTPEAINQDSYEAWLIEAEQVSDTEELLDAAGYEAFIAAEG